MLLRRPETGPAWQEALNQNHIKGSRTGRKTSRFLFGGFAINWEKSAVINKIVCCIMGLPGGLVIRNAPANIGDAGDS